MTMDYGLSIAQSIAELGILVVIAGIFLYFTIKNNQKQDEINTKLFKTILDQLQNANQGHILTEEEDRTAVQIDKTINSYLQSAVTDLGASRAMVARYHNGGKDMNAISFLKVSVTNECVSHGCLPCIGDFQNQFRSMVGFPVYEIDRTGHCIIRDIEEIKDSDIGTYELLKARGVRSVYCHKLTNMSGYVIGALMIIYRQENKVNENPEKIDCYISHMADQISGLLNAKDAKDK